MKLTRLNLTNFRNFNEYELEPSEKFNLITANNGCGKTSLLEAIYLLGMGRSFRSHTNQPIIQYQKDFCRTVGEFSSPSNQGLKQQANLLQKADSFIIGIEKHTDSTKSIVRVDGQDAKNIAELAQRIPIQLIHHETFHLLDAGPQHRREFLDWGVFYSEPLYFNAWQRFQRALKQRNALLKNMDTAQLDFWEHELASQGKNIDQYRRMYLTLLLPLISEILAPLGLASNLSLQYVPGWDNQRDYLKLLQQSRQRDAIFGHTQYGPHRADIKIKIQQYDADHILSRGQQKMFSFAMRVAQARLLSQLSQQQAIFLIDDLAAELDSSYIETSLSILDNLPCQVFITSIHSQLFNQALDKYSIKLFHVEQ